MRFGRFMILLVVVFLWCAQVASAADVVIISGQSNATKKAHWADLTERQQYMTECPPGVRVFEWSEEIPYKKGDYFGVEVPIAHKWRSVEPSEDLIIIKCARGGTNIWQWLPHSDHTRDYPHMISAFRSVLTGVSVRKIAFVWIQGEDDTWGDEILAINYGRDLRNLITSIRADFGFPVMRAAVVVLSNPFREPSPWAYRVIQAEIDISRELPNVISVSSHGCAKYPDNVHYNAAGVVTLGNRIFSRIW